MSPTALLVQADTASAANGFSADIFKSIFRYHPGGVALITADAGDGPVAQTATSVASVSAEPPLIMFSVSAQSSSSKTLNAAETLVVHLLDASALPLATLGATSGIDRFADTTQWSRLSTGEPVFHVAPLWIRLRVISRTPAGSSTVIIAQALESSAPQGGYTLDDDPLVYVNREWHRLGNHSKITN